MAFACLHVDLASNTCAVSVISVSFLVCSYSEESARVVRRPDEVLFLEWVCVIVMNFSFDSFARFSVIFNVKVV